VRDPLDLNIPTAQSSSTSGLSTDPLFFYAILVLWSTKTLWSVLYVPVSSSCDLTFVGPSLSTRGTRKKNLANWGFSARASKISRILDAVGSKLFSKSSLRSAQVVFWFRIAAILSLFCLFVCLVACYGVDWKNTINFFKDYWTRTITKYEE
jgi:hypothetical protein